MAVHARCGALLCALGRPPARADLRRDARPRSQHPRELPGRRAGQDKAAGGRSRTRPQAHASRDACSAVPVCRSSAARLLAAHSARRRRGTHARTNARIDILRLRDALQYASRGAKEFVTELVPALKSEFPHVDLVVEAKRGHTPFIEGFYRNGRSKPIGVCLYIYSVCVCACAY